MIKDWILSIPNESAEVSCIEGSESNNVAYDFINRLACLSVPKFDNR